jgi:hypothetical protein
MALSVQAALRYLEATVLALTLVGRLDAAEVETRDLEATLDALATAAPASLAAWRLVARVVRHTVAVFEEDNDPHVLVALGLLDEAMGFVDGLAAAERQKGS